MNEIRRKDRAISEIEAIQLLKDGEYGVLSMGTADQGGYGIPLNYVYDDGAIYFHCAPEGEKLNFLNTCNKVSFCVVGKTEVMPSKFGTLYESAIAFGEISELQGEEKQRALVLFIEKYSADYRNEGQAYLEKLFDRVKILKLSVNLVTGKARKH
ncbi:MAG TPA: pyridoxamine 5'-phosphate oxidase family protein [Prolixibacteraceae bacterium]|nr:pyridoxamine 5'-phosphate oxidase family protein [Prolixibacteraceae bacterium]